jgi:hypothetical protein
MNSQNEFSHLTDDKGILKKVIKSGEGEHPKDNQEVEGIRNSFIFSSLYREI